MKYKTAVWAALLSISCPLFSAWAEEPFAAAYKTDGRWGLLNGQGQEATAPVYDKMDPSLEKDESQRAADLRASAGKDMSRSSLIEVQKNSRRGFLDRTGHVVVPAEYQDRSVWKDGHLAVEQNRRLGFYDLSGRQTSSYSYKEVSDYRDGMAAVRTDRLYGFVDGEGRETVPELYQDVNLFSGGLAVVKKDGSWGAVNASGGTAVPFLYEDAGPFFSEGLLAVKKGGLWGYVNTSGQAVIPFVYEQASPLFHEGLAAVKKKGALWGFINPQGDEVIAPRFDEVLTPFSEGLAAVRTSDGKAYIDKSGKMVFSANFDQVYAFHGGLAEYRTGEVVSRPLRASISVGWGGFRGGPWGPGSPFGFGPGWRFGPFFYDPWFWDHSMYDQEEIHRGYIDRSGRIIADAALDHVYPMTDIGALVKNNGRYGWISRTGNYTLHIRYKNIVPLPDQNLFLVQEENGRWGALTNPDGAQAVPSLYQGLSDAGSGLLAYRQNGKWGLLQSRDGRIVTPAVYDQTGRFGDGLIPVKSGQSWMYLNESGSPVLTFGQPVQDVTDFRQGRAGVRIGGRWGLIDASGHFLVQPAFDDLKIF